MPASTEPFRPIVAGFHPDPSICRVGDDFYLATSTFEYFPGLPVRHSRDLVNWELIGHVLDRPSQLDLDGVRSSGGLYAPTIRRHDGVFYVVCTLFAAEGGRGGNFVVTATDPAGPWSEPVWLGEHDWSIDPSLLFDTGDGGDGRAWFCATRPDPGAAVDGGTEIWVQEFDVPTLSLIGPQTVIWRGALRDAVWAEAPHLYRGPEGDVLLLLAEGGTGHDHAVTCARADQVTGPYRNYARNPVLTHRHLGERFPVVGAGHADLVEAADGTWWAVALAMRTRWADDGYHYPMGRESFLAEVQWEGGWPVINPGVGTIRPVQPGLSGALAAPAEPVRDDFDRPELGRGWSFVRTPRVRIASLTDRPGHLSLYPQPVSIEDVGCPAFVARPQDAWEFTASGRLEFEPRGPGDVAGIVLRQNEDFSLQLLISHDDSGRRVARAVRRFAGVNEVAAEVPAPEGPLVLSVSGSGLEYTFTVEDDVLAELDGRGLSTSLAGGFTGTMLGPYTHAASSEHRVAPDPPTAFWAWFEYRPT